MKLKTLSEFPCKDCPDWVVGIECGRGEPCSSYNNNYEHEAQLTLSQTQHDAYIERLRKAIGRIENKHKKWTRSDNLANDVIYYTHHGKEHGFKEAIQAVLQLKEWEE